MGMKTNKQLSWVQGNDVLLLLWLWERKAVGSGMMQEQTTAFAVDEAEDLTVTAATACRGIPLEWKPAESQGANCLVVEMPASMPAGDYAVQVKCTVRGRRVRSFESAVFCIVRTNGEANTVLTRIGGARGAETSMEIQFVSSAVARGKNAYELWLEAGNEGTIDDFLNHYIADVATTEADGLMSHGDKKKLDDLPSSTELEIKLEELGDAIGEEQRRAEQAEQTLGGAISTESESREAADTTLSGAINNEAEAREAADNALGGRATELEGRVSDIEGKIPQQASPQNQLADKNFVNSSISTATAEFKGTYNSLAELEQVEANMNDYAFVVGQDAAGNTVYSRYKYVGQTRGSNWSFEFDLNNSSFTAAQWAAINSAITSGDVEKLAALPTKQQLDMLFSGKQDVISDLATIRSGAALGASAVQTETDPTVPLWAKQSTKPSYTPQEVGALPANTPLFDGDYNSLANKPDLSGFITISVNNLVNYYLKSETYTKQEVQALIAAIQQFHYEIYASTSDVTSPQGNVLYLIGPTGTGADKYEEYVYDSTKQEPWVKIGDTSIDLSDYYTKGQTDSAITQALNTALADYTTTAALTLLLAGKQDVINDLAEIRSGAALGATALQTETDPTVPAWAKQSSKPTYTAQEVGALPADTQLFSGDYNDLYNKPTIPDDLADLNDDSTHRTVSDAEKTTWGNKQDTLVSGTNIKTINNQSILGAGNINIQGSYTPTLQSAPTSSTTTYTKDGQTVDFEIGQFARVAVTGGYDFYQLRDLVTENNVTTAVWAKCDELPDNVVLFAPDGGEGIVPDDGIRAETVNSGATISVNPDVVTLVDGAVGTAAITLQVPNDNLAHVWDILMTTDSTVAVTIAMSNSATIKSPSSFAVAASKDVEISVIGKGSKYYLRYGEFA